MPLSGHSLEVSFSLKMSCLVYPLKLLVVNGGCIIVQQGTLFLYIAEGCMNIPFLFECSKFTLGISFVFCSSSSLMECGNITNKKKKQIYEIAEWMQIIYSLFCPQTRGSRHFTCRPTKMYSTKHQDKYTITDQYPQKTWLRETVNQKAQFSNNAQIDLRNQIVQKQDQVHKHNKIYFNNRQWRITHCRVVISLSNKYRYIDIFNSIHRHFCAIYFRYPTVPFQPLVPLLKEIRRSCGVPNTPLR